MADEAVEQKQQSPPSAGSSETTAVAVCAAPAPALVVEPELEPEDGKVISASATGAQGAEDDDDDSLGGGGGGDSDGDDGGEGEEENNGADDGEDGPAAAFDFMLAGTSIDPNAIDAMINAAIGQTEAGDREDVFVEPKVLVGRGLKLRSFREAPAAVAAAAAVVVDGPALADSGASQSLPALKPEQDLVQMVWIPGGRQIICGYRSGHIERCTVGDNEISYGERARAVADRAADLTALCWASETTEQDGGRVLIGTSTGGLALVSLASLTDIATLRGHTDAVSCVVWRAGTSHGKLTKKAVAVAEVEEEEDDDFGRGSESDIVVSCSWDNSVRIWSLTPTGGGNSGAPDAVPVTVLHLPEVNLPFRAVCMSPLGDEVMAAAGEHLAIFDVRTQTLRMVVRGCCDTPSFASRTTARLIVCHHSTIRALRVGAANCLAGGGGPRRQHNVAGLLPGVSNEIFYRK